MLSRQFGHLTQLGVWPENCVGIAIIIFILVARCSLSVATEVLATSTIASVFTIVCSRLQSLLGPSAQENFCHRRLSPVAKKEVLGGTIDMCFCDVDECRTSCVPCARVVIFLSLFDQLVAQMHVTCAAQPVHSASMDIAVFQKAMRKSLA